MTKESMSKAADRIGPLIRRLIAQLDGGGPVNFDLLKKGRTEILDLLDQIEPSHPAHAQGIKAANSLLAIIQDVENGKPGYELRTRT